MQKDQRARRRIIRPAEGGRRQDGRYELPYARLHGGDRLRGGDPCAPGHAGRRAASLASTARERIDDLDRRARKVAQAVLATTLLVVAQVMGLLSCISTPALAATGNDPKTVTADGGYISRHALDGQEAYCCNSYLSSPPKGTVVSRWHSGPLMLDYVLYHASGGAESRWGWEPTRYAVWAIMEGNLSYLTTYGSGEAMPAWFSAQVTEEYNAAKAWADAGGVGPERGCSRVYDSPSSAYQPLCVCGPLLGDVELEKRSALEGISADDACYSLEGAEYTVYQDETCSRPAGKLVTDAAGKAELKSLYQGSYWVRESKAPLGFKQDENTYQITVVPSKAAKVNGSTVNDTPLYAQVGTLVQKGDFDLAARGAYGQAQGDASLAGARFVIKRYANTLGNHSGSAVRSWTIATGADGTATLDDEHLVSGDELYRDSLGNAVLPLGTYVMQETSAPEGYLVNDSTTCVFVIYQEGNTAKRKDIEGTTRPDGTSFLVDETVIRGGVALGKVDAQRADHVPEGAGQLEGAVIAIRLESDQPVVVNGTTFMPGSTVTSLTIGADGTASTASDLLPYGTYRAYEVEAPRGYLLTREGTWSRTFMIREQGVIVDLSEEWSSVPDQVKRGDLEFVKVDGRDMQRLGGVPFLIESLTTGEKHVVVTDENGYCSTSSSFVPHTESTNANDDLIFGLGAQSEEALAPVDEAQGDVAEPVEDEAQEGLATPVEDEETTDAAEQSGEEATDATENEEEIQGEESLEDAPQGGEPEEEEAPDVDELQPGELPAGGAQEEAEPAEEAAADLVAQAELTATTSGVWFSGGTDKEVPVNDLLGALPYDTYQVSELRAPANEGYDLLSFQIVLTRHNYVIDAGTLDDHPLPTIQTSLATVASSEGSNLWQLSDVVTFADVKTDGTEYELHGTLHLVGEDGSDQGALSGASASVTFAPRQSYGTVEVPFEIDVSELRGRTIVAFEELWCDGELVATHADITDTDQSVTVPDIGTTLTDAEGAQETDGTKAVTLVDHVRYEGLNPEKSYVLTGTLMDKKTGNPVLDESGNAITSEATFTPEEASGTVDVTFVFDGAPCRGTTVVAFESLWQDGIELAVHANIEDKDQSVQIPKIMTSAADGSDGDKEVLAEEGATIVDTVTYEGLMPGEEYTLTGRLVDRKTGTELTAGDGPLTATATFVPDAPDGTAEMRFELDAHALAGTELTVFETLSRDGRTVARHEDLSSDEQSVRIPKIGTTAQTKDGKKSVEAAKKQVIVDTVSYEGLTPGREYVATGTLHLRDSAGKDLGPLVDAHKKPVSASATFVPDEPSGTVEVSFTVDTADLGGKDLVAFEVMTVAQDKSVVAKHEDISDGGQSVSVNEPPKTPPAHKALPKTGDLFVPLKALVVSGILTLAGAALMRWQDRKGAAGHHLGGHQPTERRRQMP